MRLETIRHHWFETCCWHRTGKYKEPVHGPYKPDITPPEPPENAKVIIFKTPEIFICCKCGEETSS